MRVDGEKTSDIASALATNYSRLGPSQRRVIDRLLEDTRYAAVISASELALEVGVSESTVTRAAQALGFSGYPDLQSRLRRRFVDAVSDRIQASQPSLGETAEMVAVRVMFEDADSVRATAEDLSQDVLRNAIEILESARRVYIVGVRGSAGLAIMLGMGLQLLLPDVRILNSISDDIPDQLASLEPEDALVAISFRRVDRTTVRVVRYAAGMGARTIAITDVLSSPIARLAELTLIARLGPLRLMPSYAAGASLVNALITAISLPTRDKVSIRLQRAESLWQSFDVHYEE